MRGLIRAGVIGSVAFNLPAGLRPSTHLIFSVVSASAAGEVRIYSTGDVQVTTGSNVWVSLDGVRFRPGG
jgi:hypothetical protein